VAVLLETRGRVAAVDANAAVRLDLLAIVLLPSLLPAVMLLFPATPNPDFPPDALT
jgi:hypothetical protein